MIASVQILLMILGVALTALATQAVSVLTGMRADIKALITRMDDEAEARHELSERVLILETEHRSSTCRRTHSTGAVS